MMMPDSGVPDSVTGSNRDIAEIGPMPGSTPTSVPMKTPMKQYSRLIGRSATPNPCATLTSVSMRSTDPEQARGELDQQQPLEYPPHSERHQHRDRNCQCPAHGIDQAQQKQHERDRRQQESQRLEGKGERGEAGDNEKRLAPAHIVPARSQRRPALGDGRDDNAGREHAHQDARVEQYVARAGIVDGAELELHTLPDHEAPEREPDQAAPEFGVVETEFDVSVV